MSDSDHPFVSVIIPVFNDMQHLPGCLEALDTQSYPASRLEVIVVDNGQNQGVENLAAEHPHTTLIREDETGSYAARNTGIAQSTGQIIAFTDADCLPDPDWLRHGVELLEATPNCGMIGGRVDLQSPDPTKPNMVELYERATAFQQRRYIERMRFAATANVITYRRVIDDVGDFDASVKSLGDHEWGQRVYKGGYAQVYGHNVIVKHRSRSTWAELRQRTVRKAGGKHDKQKARGKRCAGFFLDLFKALFPYARLKCIVSSDHLHGVGQRLSAVMILGCVNWQEIIERFRLQLGGESHRA